jgi:hypothetical protein
MIDRETGYVSQTEFWAETATCHRGNTDRGAGSVVTTNPPENLTVSRVRGHYQRVTVQEMGTNRNESVSVGDDGRVVHVVEVSQPGHVLTKCPSG